LTSAPAVTTAKSTSHESLQEMLEETERNQILRALEEADGVVAGPNGAAARLAMKRSTLQLRMQKLGIRLSRTAVDERKQTAGWAKQANDGDENPAHPNLQSRRKSPPNGKMSPRGRGLFL
jgi:hypothetical protein